MKTLCLLAVAGLAGVASADTLVNARVERVMPLGQSGGVALAPLPGAVYSNITNFRGQALAQGASAVQGTNTITRMLMDDIDAVQGDVIRTMRFSVANLNTVAVTARARLRFWNADGVNGGPGTYFQSPVGTNPTPGPLGFTFNPLSFGPGVTTLTADFTGSEFVIPATKFWVGVTFDNNNGGDQTALFNNMGQGIFDPVDIGSSADQVFLTTGAGSFFTTANPAGSLVDLGASVANLGYEFVAVPTPGALALLGMGGLVAARRRR
ncbi:MAG: hypothetical protein SFZ23_16320 [Planctomycetota bacterium]|nr:hypothetical protein [Planctomycetota bacterium]